MPFLYSLHIEPDGRDGAVQVSSQNVYVGEVEVGRRPDQDGAKGYILDGKLSTL